MMSNNTYKPGQLYMTESMRDSAPTFFLVLHNVYEHNNNQYRITCIYLEKLADITYDSFAMFILSHNPVWDHHHLVCDV